MEDNKLMIQVDYKFSFVFLSHRPSNIAPKRRGSKRALQVSLVFDSLQSIQASCYQGDFLLTMVDTSSGAQPSGPPPTPYLGLPILQA